jgi:hypothetical protein
VRRSRVPLVAALALSAGWLALGTIAVVYLGGALVQMWARALVLIPQAAVWLFVALREGMDWWSIAGRVGSALADVIVTPQALSWLIGLELVGAVALYGLQRLFKGEIREEQRGDSAAEVRR